MAHDRSAIEWTDATWNPTSGCTHVSAGCQFCYAEALSLRFGHTKKPWTKPHEAENVKLHPGRMDQPYRWKRPRRIFVDSMSDLFHPLVPDGYIAWVWLTMVQNPRHTFQLLTKRPARMRAWVRRWNDLAGEPRDPQLVRGPAATRDAHPSGRGQLFAAYLEAIADAEGEGGEPPSGAVWPTFDWMEGPRWWPRLPPWHVWLGTSVEDQRVAHRIDDLLATPAAVRFLSVEPMLGPVDLSAWLGTGALHWVICGGESGPHHRPFDPDWARRLRDDCRTAGVPFFFKQHGGRTPQAGGRLLDGRTWDEFPTAAGR